MTTYDRPDRYIVTCTCDFEKRFSSKATAREVCAYHDDQCFNQPEISEIGGHT